MRRTTALTTTASLVAALLAVPATYAVLRAYDAWTTPPVSPVAGITSIHIPMFWRLLVGSYVGGMAGMVTFVIARRHPAALDATFRALSTLVVVVAAVALLQGLLVP